MSATIVDMPKVCQSLDAGWTLVLFKNRMGSYSVRANHIRSEILESLREKLRAIHPEETRHLSDDCHFDEFEGVLVLVTDDFTPEQALTRAAYKIHGEII